MADVLCIRLALSS